MFHLYTNELGTAGLINNGALLCENQSILCSFYKNIPTFLVELETLFIQLSEKGLDIFLYFIVVVSQASLFYGTYLLSSVFSPSKWLFLITYFLTLCGCLNANTIGYGYISWEGVVSPGLIFQCIGLIPLALMLKEKYFGAAVLIGILANLHPIIAAILGTFLFFILIIERIKISHFISIIAVMVIIASPNIARVLTRIEIASVPSQFKQTWWALMELTKSHHVFPWRDSRQLFGFFASFFGIGFFGWAFWKKGTSRNEVKRIFTISVCVACFVAITFFATEYLKISFFASSMLSRASVFLIPLLNLLVACHILRVRERGSLWSTVLMYLMLVLLTVPGRFWHWEYRVIVAAALFMIVGLDLFESKKFNKIFHHVLTVAAVLISLSLSSFGLDPYYSGKMYILCGLGLSILVGCLLLFRNTLALRNGVFAVFLVTSSLFHISLWSKSFDFLVNSINFKDYIKLGQWFQYDTLPEHSFLAPPRFVKLGAHTRRLPVTDGIQPGLSMYAHEAIELDTWIFKNVYSLDIANPEKVRRIANSGFSNYINQQYYNLDESDIQRLTTKFPGLAFVIHERQKKTRTLNLPVVYENPSYIVYKADKSLKGIQYPREIIEPFFKANFADLESWTKANQDVTLTQITQSTEVISNLSTYDYQLVSQEVYLDAGEALELLVEYDAVLNQSAIGVLDSVENKWLLNSPLSENESNLVVHFKAKNKRVKLVLTNHNPVPRVSKTRIKTIRISRPVFKRFSFTGKIPLQ